MEENMGHPHNSTYDAIIIGLGAAGSVFAHKLTRAGYRVLALERGKHYQNHGQEFVENELAMWPLVWDNARYEVEGNGFTGAPNLGIGVGGGTLAWTGVCLRFFARDFRFRSTYGRPAGSTAEDWPISLSDLARYYDEAEKQMSVSGTITPWDPEGRRPPPNPPLPYYPSSRLLEQGMQRLGIRSAPGSIAINSREHQGRPACVNAGFCRTGCRIDAKYHADRVLVSAALETGLLDLRSNVIATRIETSPNGRRVRGVTYLDPATGRRETAKGRVVIASNNPIELPRLFLESDSPAHPNGLGNQFDQVGRNFFCHVGSIGMGITRENVRTAIGENMGNIMTLDFSQADPQAPYRGGFALMSLNGSGAGVMAVDPLRRFYGADLKERMSRYNQSLLLITFGEGLPAAANRITIDRSKLDEHGRPVARVQYTLLENDIQVLRASLAKMEEVLRASGAEEVHLTKPAFEAHPMGTMRMGRDPRTSVTDRWGEVHGVRNLFVGGAALFVTGSSVNPTLTLHALALRTADRIVRRLLRVGQAA
jgi:choline dehydrogenase-like flavoprotein